ncbi:hemolysin-III related-domain-containing protein, partial [Penicillium manginii]|uniref:hemolysin-III related-domain-containing protein n=1 Tax=Penicillium manginii TaxID=203109 RepID=UPI002546D290
TLSAVRPRPSDLSWAVLSLYESLFASPPLFSTYRPSTFHTVQNHSSHIARIANQVDYIGIVLLIVGSFIMSIFYGFYCHPNLQRVYLTMFVLTFLPITSLGLLCAAISANPQFGHPTWRPFWAGMIISLGLSALFPIVHGVRKFGIRQMNKQIGLFWIFHIMVVLAIMSHLRGLVDAFEYNHSVMALHC